MGACGGRIAVDYGRDQIVVLAVGRVFFFVDFCLHALPLLVLAATAIPGAIAG